MTCLLSLTLLSSRFYFLITDFYLFSSQEKGESISEIVQKDRGEDGEEIQGIVSKHIKTQFNNLHIHGVLQEVGLFKEDR